jgi:hypothetical protein
MAEAEFQRDDRQYERQLDRRDELEREDVVMNDILTAWRAAVAPRRPAQPVAALLDGIRDEWEAA